MTLNNDTQFCCLISMSPAIDFNYPSPNDPFPKWGGLCDSGTSQSPINIEKNKTKPTFYSDFVMTNYGKLQKSLSLINNGHCVSIIGFTNEIVLTGGPLRNEFVLNHLHFHWQSEHTIDGKRFPLEAHLVHRNIRYGTMPLALEHADGIAVVSVLFHVSYTANELIGRVVESIPEVKEHTKIGQPHPIRGKIKLMSLLPLKEDYFTYSGSLTTPDCSEVVTWIVFKKSKAITVKQAIEFRGIQTQDGQAMPNNYRPLQPLHNRDVFLHLDSLAKHRGAAMQHLLDSDLLLLLAWSTLNMLL